MLRSRNLILPRLLVAISCWLLAIVTAFGLAWLCVAWPVLPRAELAATRPTRTHVLLVTVDTLRPDHMSAYGYERDTTPNIARFFRGRLFQRARSSAPCTVPSVKQLLSGRLDAEGKPLAQILHEHGFYTAAIVSQQQFIDDTWGYARGFDEWDAQRELDHHNMSARDARDVSEHALAFLARREASTQPFFLWLHYFDPHDPYDPPAHERVFARNVSSFANGDRRAAQQAAKTDETAWHLVDRIFTQEDRDNLTRLYDDEIRYVDEQLGRVFAAIDERFAGDQVLVVLTADHGELLGENAAWDHCYGLGDTELHVPLAVRGFRRSVGRALAQRPTSTLDVVPTLLRELDIPRKELTLDGTPVWAGYRRHSTAVFDEHASIANDAHKLHVSTKDGRCTPERLVALDHGLDVVGRELPLDANAQVVDRLSQALCEKQLRLQRAMALAAEDLARLKALGYTE